ncbi:hypothetical protein Hanom_Chr14g01314941 [Helianthus anomalus]
MRWNKLSRIHDAIGIQSRLYLSHRPQIRCSKFFFKILQIQSLVRGISDI